MPAFNSSKLLVWYSIVHVQYILYIRTYTHGNYNHNHMHTHSQLTTQCIVFCMIHTEFLSFTLTPRSATRYLATSLCWCSAAKWSKLSPNYVHTLTQGMGYIIYTQNTLLDMTTRMYTQTCYSNLKHFSCTYVLYKPLDEQSKSVHAQMYRCKHTCAAHAYMSTHTCVFSSVPQLHSSIRNFNTAKCPFLTALWAAQTPSCKGKQTATGYASSLLDTIYTHTVLEWVLDARYMHT